MLPVERPPLGMMIDLLSGVADYGVEDFYAGDGSGKALGFDVVADLEWLEQEYEHSAGKVLEGAAQGHAYGYACRGEEGEKGACLYAEDAYDGDDQDEVEHDSDEREHEGAQ